MADRPFFRDECGTVKVLGCDKFPSHNTVIRDCAELRRAYDEDATRHDTAMQRGRHFAAANAGESARG